MYGYSNPMFDYQRNSLLAQQNSINQQLNQLQMAQNPPQQPTFNPYPQPQQPQYFLKQVGSIEEAKGFPVDPNMIYLFPDTGTGRIYLKKLNTENGKSELYTYSPMQDMQETAKADPMDEIKDRLANIEMKIGGLYESISDNAAGAERNEKPNGSIATADARKNAKPKPAEVQ